MRVASMLVTAVGALALVELPESTAGPRGGTAAPPTPPGAWTGTAEGGVFQTRSYDDGSTDPKSHVEWKDEQTYRAKFSFSFRIGPTGEITGAGKGEYTDLRWHYEGTNGKNGRFSCDPEVTAEPFEVSVVGRASGRKLLVELRLVNAFEDNKRVHCGADYYLNAGSTHRIIDSLEATERRKLSLEMSDPSVRRVAQHDGPIVDGRTRIERDHDWHFELKHDCKASDYTDPSASEYINQYDAGDALGLPVNHGQQGGNACGPTSLTMAVNRSKRENGSQAYPDLQGVYDETVTGTNFDWVKGVATAWSMGFYEASMDFGADFIDSHLPEGPVLASTTYSTGTGPGGGHVVLVTGRTAEGDYIVSDPAGDWYSSPTRHYGDGKCGDNVVYPKEGFRDHARGRPALALPRSSGADPRVVVAVAKPVRGRRPYTFAFRVGPARYGARIGWVRGGRRIAQLPGWVGYAPVVPSDPAAPAVRLRPDRWPYAVVLRTPIPNAVLEIHGDRAAAYDVELSVMDGGKLSLERRLRGRVARGQTAVVALDLTVPRTRISSPRNGSAIRVRRPGRLLGVASDRSGIASVSYSLQDATTGRYYRPRARRFSSRTPVQLAAIVRRLAGGRASWSAALPRAMQRGRSYVARATARDRAGNLQVAVRLAVNAIRIRAV